MNPADKRILIVKPSSLGDVVHTLPVVHAIKRTYPSCYIGWIVQKSFSAILESDPAVDEIIPISIPSTSDPLAARGAFMRAAVATVRTVSRLRKLFREHPYDIVLDLHASFRSGLLSMTNPNGLRVGFADAKELNTFFQHHRLVTDSNKPHAVDKNLVFARHLECVPQPEDFRVAVAPEARKRVRDFLTDNGIGEGERVVYANPAARWSTKMWSVDAWARLADLFIGDLDAAVVLSGGPGDVPYIDSIAERSQERPLIAAGRLSLADAVALIDAADVYVGVDSGPMHIAAFTGTPVVALFGPTDPAKVGPYGTGHKVVRHHDLDCLACRKRSCDNHRCLEEITPERILDETRTLMGW
ncbi:MAG: glycosyltransferase family 9 protein [Desulfomonilaceae bacterium]|nr:glycosyltransferase family 9 protein [Desulfomonilaceae bacterium]